MRATMELPADPTLPALAAIRRMGLARAIPALELGSHPVDVSLCGYTPGERATLEVRAGARHFVVKVYAHDPGPEAELYDALAAAGLGHDSQVRVPPLLALDRGLRVLVVGWLEGPAANELVKLGNGRRAGELAARWLQRSATLSVNLGPPLDAAAMLTRVGSWIGDLGVADPALTSDATALLGRLSQSWPAPGSPHLLHGTYYARHVLDLGDGVGIVDWERFAQGPAEFDAAMFLTTTWRTGLGNPTLTREAARAEQAFLAVTEGLLDECALGWYRAAVMLHFTARKARRQHGGDWRKRAEALLGEAGRLAENAG